MQNFPLEFPARTGAPYYQNSNHNPNEDERNATRYSYSLVEPFKSKRYQEQRDTGKSRINELSWGE
jgi:hypothetical protein